MGVGVADLDKVRDRDISRATAIPGVGIAGPGRMAVEEIVRLAARTSRWTFPITANR